MPILSFVTARLARRATALALGLSVILGGAAALPSAASASHTQISMIQDFGDLYATGTTLQTFRALGANTIRVIVPWGTIAPNTYSKTKPNGFNASDPNAYPASNWAPYDAIIRTAQQDGLTVDLTVSGGAPRWAEGAAPPCCLDEPADYVAWRPNAAAYGQFVHAIAERYDGSFTPAGASGPLPAVHFWAIFNEPNFGLDLGPQAVDGSRVATAPAMYRGLLNAAWSALRSFSAHQHDTILIGEFAARGLAGGPSRRYPGGFPGNYGQTKPLIFIRELYCVDNSYRQLRGSLAAAEGCPTSAAASRRFRSQNPALFSASGVGDHPYPGNQNPVLDGRTDRDFAAFPELGNLEGVLDRVNRIYGSGTRFPIYNDEYGYITDPPNKQRVAVTGGHYVSPATAAVYINWAEYLSWKQPRVQSYMQYLLEDPPPNAGAYSGFSSGLETYSGGQKATYSAYRLPVYMPRTAIGTGPAEIWGDVRPAPFMIKDGNGPESVAIQLNNKTIDTVTVTGSVGYFDVHIKFPRSGNVRLAYTYPTVDPFLPVGVAGSTVYSRSFAIKVR
jgi:hypothetical protein